MIHHPENARRCSDCNAIPRNGAYEHERGCPLFHELEAVKLDDLDWLIAHPGEVRMRKLTAAERAEHVMFSGSEPRTDTVGVFRYGNQRVRMMGCKAPGEVGVDR